MSKLLRFPDHPGGYRINLRAGGRPEIFIYGIIGRSIFEDGISARRFADDLRALGPASTIDLRINSDGGDVFEGKAIFSLLNAHKARIVVHVDGLAASVASLIAMAGDEIRMADGAFMMIHNAWGMKIGDAAEMNRMAELLGSVDATLRATYAARTKQPLATITKMMSDETWMNAQEAVAKGFADSVVGGLQIAAMLNHRERFRRLPAALQRAPSYDPTKPNRAKALAMIANTKLKLTR
jgi:ATP-dependent protease ClpP protease subunit